MTGNVLELRIDHEARDREIVTYGTPREDRQETGGLPRPPLTPTPHPLNLSKQTQRLLPPSTLPQLSHLQIFKFLQLVPFTYVSIFQKRKKKKKTFENKNHDPTQVIKISQILQVLHF